VHDGKVSDTRFSLDGRVAEPARAQLRSFGNMRMTAIRRTA